MGSSPLPKENKMNQRFAIRVEKKNVEVERFSQHGAIGWRITDPCSGNVQVHFDEIYAAKAVFKAGTHRGITEQDKSHLLAIEIQL